MMIIYRGISPCVMILAVQLHYGPRSALENLSYHVPFFFMFWQQCGLDFLSHRQEIPIFVYLLLVLAGLFKSFNGLIECPT